MKKTSIKDLAKHLNVSVPTVSLVLNGRGDEKRISQETQKRIIEYAADKNYKPNSLAKGLRRGRSEMIGLIIPNISDVFYARIAHRIEKEAARRGYTVIYSSSEESGRKESELIRSMLDRQVEGLIIASTQKNEADILKLKRMKFPFVLIDRYYPNIDTDYVIIDNKGGVEKAVLHLINHNRSRIGFVSLKPELDAIKDRFFGYKETLECNGIEFNPEYVQELNIESYEEEMSVAFDHFDSLQAPLDSIIFSTHFLTISGLREIRNRNWNVPTDVGIISFDERSAFDLIEPPITAVTQPVLDIGNKAVGLLLDRLDSTSIKYTKVVLETGFIVRKSSQG